MSELSILEARRTALAAQGFGYRELEHRTPAAALSHVLKHVGLIQIDSVNVLARSQELPLFARLGGHDRALIPLAHKKKKLFEYWGHEASHIPVTQHHLWRWKMDAARAGSMWRGVNEIQRKKPTYVADVLARVRDGGAVVAGDLSQRTGPKGTWWDWDEAKVALEYLFWVGELTARRRNSDFARIYDIPERMIPAKYLNVVAPCENDARRELLLLAAHHVGVGTLHDIADYHRQSIQPARRALHELVEDGALVQVRVEGWKDAAYMATKTLVPIANHGASRACALLSPFDSLVWFRARNERLFDFRYRIEIYTPKAKRQFGYYVLPFLQEGELVGRIDLKADRKNSILKVQGSFIEEPINTPTRRKKVASGLAVELRAMAAWLELETIEVAVNGSLAREVQQSLT